MKMIIYRFLVMFLGAHSLLSETEPHHVPSSPIGENPWTEPGWIFVRATFYPKGDGDADAKIDLEHATPWTIGSAAVASWFPRGSLIRLWDKSGQSYLCIAMDEGPHVEERKAAKELGKTSEEKKAPVVDVCMPRPMWEKFEDFIWVEVWNYVGTRPFDKLSKKEQEALRDFAVNFVKR